MIYLDHAATTPLDERVLEEMLPFLRKDFGNPSSVHAYGREARNAIEDARQKVAETLNADPKEIIFTSGATESVNMAQKGAAWANRQKGSHLVLSAIEHSSVLNSAEWLGKNGFQVTFVPVTSEGIVDVKEVEKALRKETTLISIMGVNNEVGSIQPFRAIGRMARERGILYHMDAVQAYGKVPLDVKNDCVDFLSVSAHKIHGPKGAGFLYQRKGVGLVPLLHGGGQEKDRRGGTENVAGIVGLGEAARLLFADIMERSRVELMADLFLDELKKACPEAQLNGPSRKEDRVPGILNITLPGIEGETLVHSLDAKGFAASSGAACGAGAAPPSHVLLAMGRSPREAKEGLRLSLGRSNTGEQLRELAQALPEMVRSLRLMSSMLEDDDEPKPAKKKKKG